MPVPGNGTLPFTGGGSDLATWIIAISILISTILSILAFLGIAQGMQMRVWKNQIEARLRILEEFIGEVRGKAEERLRRAGAKNPQAIVDRAADYFYIEPVTLEPTDVIRRLERILRTGEERIESLVERSLPRGVERRERHNIVTLLSIVNALNMIYKFLRHLLLLGLKTKNPMIVAQAWMITPLYMRIAKAYRDAAGVIEKGAPIGDAAGPLAAYKLMREFERLEPPREIVKDTVVSLHVYKGRRVYIVKAMGPGSTVGRPGEAVERIASSLAPSARLAAIVTVDAALKFEGEETGTVAEGGGVAMGDPGPEKIRIERVASRLGVPLYAVAIKMGFEEAITGMTKEVVEGVRKAVERVKEIIETEARPGDAVIVVGVGNTIGVAQ